MKKIEILFLCTGNSCRSQMAEGWARHLKSDRIHASSAGIEAYGLNPEAVKVMAEAGVDISRHQSQSVNEFKNVHFDYVVTVCDHAHEVCPLFLKKSQVVHVGFEDPIRLAKKVAAQGGSVQDELDCYRKVRDEIKAFVETLPEFLQKNKKGFVSKMIEKLDKKLEAKAKKSSCCGGGGSSCC